MSRVCYSSRPLTATDMGELGVWLRDNIHGMIAVPGRQFSAKNNDKIIEAVLAYARVDLGYRAHDVIVLCFSNQADGIFYKMTWG
jgi:hypothetical protein